MKGRIIWQINFATYFDLAYPSNQMIFESGRNQQFWFEPEETLSIVKDACD